MLGHIPQRFQKLDDSILFLVMRRESRAQRGNPWKNKLDVAAGVWCDRTHADQSVGFLFVREVSGIRSFEKLCMAGAGFFNNAQVKICSGLGWGHIVVDQGFKFSLPEEVFFVIVVAEKVRVKRLETGIL